MTRKILALLSVTLLTTAAAQDGQDSLVKPNIHNGTTTAKNFVTFSPGFTITDITLGAILGSNMVRKQLNKQLNMEVDDGHIGSETLLRSRGEADIVGIRSSGFGFALQYERPMIRNYSLMGRFSYSGFGMKLDIEDRYIDFDLSQGPEVCINVDDLGNCVESIENSFYNYNYYNWSVEVHNRYYLREGGAFFLDGVIGFGSAGLRVKKSHIIEDGDYIIREPDGSFTIENRERTVEMLNVPSSIGYMSIGPMTGWRKVYGLKSGDFIWEMSLGYLFGIGFGKSLTNRVVDGNVAWPDVMGNDAQEIDDTMKKYLNLIEMLTVTGGPRFRMTFGWGF
ncbi:MAG: hypothetical protein LBC70_10585 [Chitinispirillales bacterium]|jgi:hypothetical protein|nr:hypothetical protein [Chitinispirillales bacterium]